MIAFRFSVINLAAVLIALGGHAHAKDETNPVTPAGENSLSLPTPKAEPFDLKQVRLLGGPFRDAMERDAAYLLSLDPDRLLHTFRLTGGLPSTAKPLGGWEAPGVELRGHSLGHYLSALSLMYSSTGNAEFKKRADYIVEELAKCQEHLPTQGYHPGYLAAFPESFFDRVDHTQHVWAPYYTLHKIMAGLFDAYAQCGNRQALDVLEKTAAWLDFRVKRLSHEQMQAALGNEHGGMNEVLANLYAVTRNPLHLQLARAFNHEAVFNPLAQSQDKLDGLHANTQIPKIIGAAREYELTGDTRYRDIASFFWERVSGPRAYVIGGHSDNEHFFPVADFAAHLSPATAETCNTYNMLKLTRHLYAWDASPARMDYYERALYNHILASQDPKKGMFVYLMSLKPGHFKTYSTPEDSFWCCVGTGMENHAKYGDTIFYHNSDTLFLNLFIAAELDWNEKGLRVTQDTRFPERNSTSLTFHCDKPLRLTLQIRHPAWAGDGFAVQVNGKDVADGSRPGSYAALTREWHDGDQVQIRLPMTLHTEPLSGNPGTVAILDGPILLAGALGTDGMPDPYAKHQTDLNRVPSPPVPVFVCKADELTRHIVPDEGKKTTFHTRDIGKPGDVTLIPFYLTHHQRYSVYWRIMSEEEWAGEKATRAADEAMHKAQDARLVDEVKPGDTQSETDHHLQALKSRTGAFQGRHWRDADARGSFGYELKNCPGTELVLQCEYWGSDAKGREFEILANGHVIGTQKLENDKPGAFFHEDYAIPPDIGGSGDKVTVLFRPLSGKIAGGIFGCRLLKKEVP